LCYHTFALEGYGRHSQKRPFLRLKATVSRPTKHIWEHQETFQWHLQHIADRLFPFLAEGLKPRVFVLAFRAARDSGKSLIEFIPSKTTFELLKGDLIHSLFTRLRIEPGATMALRSSSTRNAGAVKLSPYQLQRQLAAALNKGPSAESQIFYSSLPSRIQESTIGVVLTLDRATHDSFPSVPNELDRVQPYTFTSFLEAAIDRFFAICAAELRNTNPGHNMPSPNRIAILADAGRQFAARPVFSGCQYRDYSLFDHCCTISALRYEGSEVDGQIVAQARGDSSPVVRFTHPVDIASHRATRKLLELCSARLCLVSERGRIYGLVEREQVSKETTLCSIRFLRQHVWELLRGDTILMRTTLGEPSLPQPILSLDRLEDTLRRRFSGITPDEIVTLKNLIESAAEQKHGTIVVVTAEPADEARRFTNQGMIIEPTRLESGWIQAVTRIDGALLVGIDGTCHALGLILDGVASAKGTPARGARYNSALRYVRSSQKACVAVVISEDRTIDVLPDLMPQIKKLDLDGALRRLRDFEKSGDRPYAEYMRIMWWFENHRFYLRQDVCDEINGIVERIGDDTARNPMQDSINRFYPDEDMNDSYFV
jgi:hypothetical protein